MLTKEDLKNIGEVLLPLFEKIDSLEKRMDLLDEKINQMDKRIDEMNQKIDQLDKKICLMDKRIDEMNLKIDQLDEKINQMDKRIENIVDMVAEHTDFLKDMSAQYVSVRGDLKQYGSSISDIYKGLYGVADRLDSLEWKRKKK